jgi:HAD superfamily hydrolase (TIGR01459 family)
LKALSATYPVWFCDVWGVVHDGYKPFAAAADALQRHRGNGGTVVLLTNSPRTAAGVERQLGDIGVARDCWDMIVTSGDVTRTLMVEHGKGKLFHLGPDRDLSLFEGLDLERVAFDAAKAVICTGLFREFEEKPEDYLPQLRAMLQRSLAMICANPDKVVRKGENLIYCAGALAELYSEIGGTVYMAGKPYRPIYELAVEQCASALGKPVETSRILAIGDGITTDIKGASDFGLAAVVISGGINERGDVTRQLDKLAPHPRIAGIYPELIWN